MQLITSDSGPPRLPHPHGPGYVEEAAISEFAFEQQRRTFQSFGYAQDPAANGARFVGDAQKAAQLGGMYGTRRRCVHPLGTLRAHESSPESVEGLTVFSRLQERPYGTRHRSGKGTSASGSRGGLQRTWSRTRYG